MIGPAPLPSPSPPTPGSQLCLLSSPLLLVSSRPPPPLLAAAGPWIALQWLAGTSASQTSLHRYFKNLLPQNRAPSLSVKRGEWRGFCRGGRLNTADRQGFDLGPAPSATCPSHSFLHRSGNSFVWSRFSVQKKRKKEKKMELNEEETWGLAPL